MKHLHRILSSCKCWLDTKFLLCGALALRIQRFLISKQLGYKVRIRQMKVIPFNTVGVSATLPIPWFIFGLRGPLRIILSPKMRFQKDRKWLGIIKLVLFCTLPQIGINRSHRGQCSHVNTPKFDVFQVLNGYLWWY